MKLNNFEFMICSPCHLEKLVCEIYYNDEIIAEISQESNELMIEIYPCEISKWWQIPLEQIQEALEAAKNHLIKNA